MDGGVRKIEQEGLLLVLRNETNRFVGVLFDDAFLLLVGEQFRHLVIPEQRGDALSGLDGFQLHVV